MAKTCEICSKTVDNLYTLRCPNLNNEDRNYKICKDCHQEITKHINTFKDTGGKSF